MYSNKKVVRMFEQMIEMGNYFSSGRPVYVNPKLIIKDICSKIPLNKNDTVLDVGCGTGLLAIPLAQRCKQVYALDAGQRLLDKAKENGKKMKVTNVSFLKGRATNLPFQDNFFDKVIMYSVIHYLENEREIRKCVQELIRVCKSKGYILIGDIPEKKAKEEFNTRKMTNRELKILEEFKRKRKQYDELFEEKVTIKPARNKLTIDRNFLIKIAQKEGRLAKIYKQDIRQPFSLTRRDLVISSELL